MSNLEEFFEMYAYGEQGKTIFSRPFDRGVYDENSDPTNLLTKIFNTGDDRSKALVAAMVSESFIDGLLAILLPRYDRLVSDTNNFTFSTKIKLLESFEIVPLHFTAAADLIRRVRNEFAHDLHLDSLTQIDEKLVARLRTLYEQRKIRTDAGPDDVTNLFTSIVFLATNWLNFYRLNLESYARATRSPEFLLSLEDAHQRRIEKE